MHGPEMERPRWVLSAIHGQLLFDMAVRWTPPAVPMARHLPYRFAAALCALAAAAVALGALVSSRPGVAVVVCLSSVALGAGIAVERRTRILPRRPVDIALAAVVIYLPVAPYISSLSPPIATLLRAILAGYILGGLLLGAIPSQRPLGANGRWLILRIRGLPIDPTGWRHRKCLQRRKDLQLDNVRTACLCTSGRTESAGTPCFGADGRDGARPWGGTPTDSDSRFLMGRPQLLAGSGQFEQHATRYTSFILNPNNLGLVMLILAVVVHVVTRERTNTWRTSLLGSVLASVCLVVVFMTSSRGAFIGIALVGLYWFAIARRAGHYPMAMAAGLVVAVLAVPFFAPSVAPTIDKAISSTGDIFRGSDDRRPSAPAGAGTTCLRATRTL